MCVCVCVCVCHYRYIESLKRLTRCLKKCHTAFDDLSL